jgi:hypothetical protein
MSRAHLPLALVFVATLAVTACAGAAVSEPTTVPTATIAPTATNTPTAAPTPTPVDVPAAFITKLAAAGDAFAMAVSGTMKVGDLSATIEGEYRFGGGNSEQRTEIEFAGTMQAQGEINVGEERLTRTGAGPWVVATPKLDDGSSVDAFLKTLLTVKDMGLQTVDGEKLHRLQSPDSLDPASLGLAPDGATDVKAEVEFYAKPDGTPVLMVMTASWSQGAGDAALPVEAELRVRFTQLGGTVAIKRPADVWTTFTSKRWGYTVAHPEDWEVDEEREGDSFGADDQVFLAIGRAKLSGMTLDEYRAALLREYRPTFGKPETNEPIRIDGAAGYLLEFHWTQEGLDLHALEAVTARKGYGWEIFVIEYAGVEDEVRLLMDQTLSTFAFTE